MFGHTLTRYWPWWVALGWLLGYEAFALITQRATLSRLVWRATPRFPALPKVALLVVAILAAHFWIPSLQQAIWALPVVMAWLVVYFARRR